MCTEASAKHLLFVVLLQLRLQVTPARQRHLEILPTLLLFPTQGPTFLSVEATHSQKMCFQTVRQTQSQLVGEKAAFGFCIITLTQTA
jgi:hypothetical protein